MVLVERGRHPRFAIGESSTPLANLLLEELADRYDLPQIRVFSKWGTWQRSRPDVGGGLKRGFTFFFHQPGEPFGDDREHDRQLLVAASPHDDIGDTHWYRPDFDQNLVREAEAAGAIYLDETAIDRIAFDGDGATLDGTRLGQPVRISASFVVDASGPRGFLSRALDLDAPPLRWLPPTQGLYTHFENVTRWDVLRPDAARPYPPDAAALHHVFPGGWIWMLRFNNGITSAGAALTDASPRSIRPLTARRPGIACSTTLPSVREQFEGRPPRSPWIHSPRLAFRTTRVAGTAGRCCRRPPASSIRCCRQDSRSRCSASAVCSTSSSGRQRAPSVTTRCVATKQITLAELDATEQLVAALYASMGDVPLFKRLTLLYFAAASFSEAARRLNRA